MFLDFYIQVTQEIGGMCYTTKSDMVTKTNPSRVFRVILSAGYTKSGKVLASAQAQEEITRSYLAR
jgi:hypothetical protein